MKHHALFVILNSHLLQIIVTLYGFRVIVIQGPGLHIKKKLIINEPFPIYKCICYSVRDNIFTLYILSCYYYYSHIFI